MNARSLATSGKRKAKKLEKPATLFALSVLMHLSFSSHCCATSQSQIQGYNFISISRLHHINQEKMLMISIHLLHLCCDFTCFISDVLENTRQQCSCIIPSTCFFLYSFRHNIFKDILTRFLKKSFVLSQEP